jgi:hypothetical protein
LGEISAGWCLDFSNVASILRFSFKTNFLFFFLSSFVSSDPVSDEFCCSLGWSDSVSSNSSCFMSIINDLGTSALTASLKSKVNLKKFKSLYNHFS